MLAYVTTSKKTFVLYFLQALVGSESSKINNSVELMMTLPETCDMSLSNGFFEIVKGQLIL